MSRLFAPTAILLLLAVPSLSQPDSSITKPIGYDESSFSINIGGPTYALSAALGEYMSDKVECEVGLGLIGIYGGIRYHLFYRKAGQNREFLSPYTGLFCSYGMFPDTTRYFLPFSPTTTLHLPLGVQYYGRGCFTFAAEVAAVKMIYNQDKFKHDLFLWPCLRFGWHF